MSNLNDIVNVSITRATRFPTQQGFGVPLIVSEHTAFAENWRSYANIDGVAEDFATSTNEYKAANAAFSQNPRIPRLKIGKKTTNVAEEVTLTPTEQNSADYVVTVRGTTVTFTSDSDATVAEITAGLHALINALDDVTSTDNTTNLSVVSGVAGWALDISVSANIALVTATANVGVESALNTIQQEDPDFYGVLLTSRAVADQKAAAQWCESRVKLFIMSEDAAEIIAPADTSDIFSFLSGKNYDRTVMLYSADLGSFPDAAWAGKMLPKEPGSSTWKFKTLAGITADTLTDTATNAVKGKSGNVYTNVAGLSITSEGVVASGEFIDVIRGTDWIQSRIAENVYAALVNEDKIPYTNGGVDVIKAQVNQILTQAVQRSILRADPAPEVTAPLVSEISLGNRSTRTLPDVNFTGQFAGAIHKTIINGTISV